MTARAEKERYLAALEERRRRQSAAPLIYYEPHEGQKKFHAALQETRGCIGSAGNRWGKSHANSAEVVAHMYGYRPWQVPGLTLDENGDYPARDHVPSEYWIRRPDGVPLRQPSTVLLVSGLPLDRGIGTIMWPKVESLLPAAVRAHPDLHIRRGPLSVPIAVTLPNGSVLRMGSAQQGAMAFEGAAYDALAVDEPIDRACFSAIWRGLIDYFSPFWFTFTPLGANAPWIYQEFVSSPRTDITIVTGAQTDNPYLAEDARMGWEQVDLSDEEREARKFGRWGFLSHRAFPTFDPAIHVIEPFVPPLAWPRAMSCDPAHRRPYFIIWAAYDSKRDTWIAYREYPSGINYMKIRTSNMTVRDYATLIRNTEGVEKIGTRWIDPRFGPAEYTIKGVKTTSLVDDFAEYGLFFDSRVPNCARIESGIVAIRERLWYNKSIPIAESNRPRLLITKDCQNVIDGLTNLSFVPPNARDDSILDEKTAEAWKDPVDALRYLLLGGVPMMDPSLLHGLINPKDLARHNDYDADF